MNDLPAASQPASPKDAPNEPTRALTPPPRPPLTLIASAIAISAAFAIPLQHLWGLARNSDLYSHTLLIPFVSLYLVWENRDRILPSEPARLLALIPLTIGSLSLVAFFTSNANPQDPVQIETYVSYSIFAYVNFIIAATCLFVGRQALRTNLFPLIFLVWMAPFPVPVKEAIQTFFQHTSADAAYWFIRLTGIPIFRHDLIFEMPTIDMEVAPQCSGIRSSLVLFITSLVASYLFLKSNWKRAALVLLVIPLGILRNGIRILVLAHLCYHIGPEMIDSWFHKHGGPPLFVLTLAPLFIMLYLFRRSERKKAPQPA